MPLQAFNDQKFLKELANNLSKLNDEEIEEMMPQSHKSGGRMGEIRDTAHPGLVSEMLMAILASLGNPAVCQQILKRTRDDVLWDECLVPWRRSALWLAIRVTLQSTLIEALGPEKGTSEYKNFMVFLITEIASQASAANLPDDLCHIIAAKVARRVTKLGPKTLSYVQDRALNVFRTINIKQKKSWKTICDQDGDRANTIDSRSFERDTALTLNNSKQYLDAILEDRSILEPPSYSVPKCRAWLGLDYGLPSLDGLGSDKNENIYSLAEFETWVADCLPTWRKQHLATLDSKDCMALAELATEYRNAALPLYNGAPEQISIMILVIAELWYSLDVLVTSLLPIVKDFTIDITSNFFDPLLLPKRAQMQRLRVVELHIAARQQESNPINPSMFSDPVKKSFAVQFYHSSTRHQALRTRIEKDASVQRTQKEAEWRATTDEFKRLKEDAKQKACLCEDVRHRECQKCILERQAEAMTIDVYEWPLPDCEESCVSALVELDYPTELAAWRDLTWMVLHDVGRQVTVRGENPAVQLPTYKDLLPYVRKLRSRLTLASKVKPFASSHYRVKKLPVSLESCFAKNAL